METRTMSAKATGVACKDESIADKASAKLAGVADKVGGAANETHDSQALTGKPSSGSTGS
jgi:hypothetical protein